MELSKIFTTLAATILIATTAFAEPTAIEGVDWKSRIITMTGESVVPPNAVNHTHAKGLASAAARADAYRKIAEAVNGVRVEGETTVENMLITQDKIKVRVEATITGAKVVDETFLSDGGYRVTMQVPLFGVSNSLAEAIFEKNSAREPFPEPVLEIEPSFQEYNSSTSIERRLEMTSSSKENITPVPSYRSPIARLSLPKLDLQNLQADALAIKEPLYRQPNSNSRITPGITPSTMPRKSVSEYAAMAQGDYTGLIVDCRGLELQPVMNPVIKNSNGTKIYGHKNLDIDRIIREGMADYIDDAENVDRAGKNPLVVKAIAVENFNSNPVVAIPDSNRILIENHATKFLKDLKVVFLFD